MGKFKTIIASVMIAISGFAIFGMISSAVQAANQSNDVVYGGIRTTEAAKNAMATYPQLFTRYGVTQGVRVEVGAAHKNGNITDASGKIVATNGVSVGRQKLNNSSVSFVADGRTWYESANNGANVFLADSLPAFIYFKADGTFSGGIIMDCGNPLGGRNVTTPKTPGVKITKTVDYVKEKTVQVGQSFKYNLRVTNTGNVDLINAVVTDKAPEGVKFTGASHGQVAASGDAWTFTIDRLAAGSHIDYDIVAHVAGYREGAIVNTACVDAKEVPGSPDSCDDAKVNVSKPVAKQVEVCEIATSAIVTVNEGYDTAKYTTDRTKCQPIQVCDTTDYVVKTITQSEYNANKSKYSTILADCEPVTVCDTATNTIIAVHKNQMKDTYTTDQSKCGNITVCIVATKEIKTITKNEFDSTKMTTDQSKCAPAPAPVPTPQPPVNELPRTGISEIISGTAGIGAMVTAGYYWFVSRRQLS